MCLWRVAEWPVRNVAMEVYYAQHAYAAAQGPAGVYTANVTALLPYADPHTLDGTCTVVPGVCPQPPPPCALGARGSCSAALAAL